MDQQHNRLVLITGAAQSGKSMWAESLAADSKEPVHYIATMARWSEDKEGIRRIERHRRRRPPHWITHEISAQLEAAVAELPAGPAVVLIDCLSVYISNLLLNSPHAECDPYLAEDAIILQAKALAEELDRRTDLQFIVVTNEVGWGLVPPNALGRAYRDLLGAANQLFAARADTVWLCCCGLRLRLKP